MTQIKNTLGILVSKGPGFDIALRENLTSAEKDILRNANGVIANTGRYKDDIVNKINLLIKSQGIQNLLTSVQYQVKCYGDNEQGIIVYSSVYVLILAPTNLTRFF